MGQIQDAHCIESRHRPYPPCTSKRSGQPIATGSPRAGRICSDHREEDESDAQPLVPAHLHSPIYGHGKTAGWLELFYDLVFVAAFIQLGNGFSKDVSFGGFATFAAAFAALWIVWSGFTYYMNRFTVDDFVHRLMVFAQMFMVGLMAFSASDLISGDYKRFALAYAAGQAIVALFNLRSWLQVADGR